MVNWQSAIWRSHADAGFKGHTVVNNYKIVWDGANGVECFMNGASIGLVDFAVSTGVYFGIISQGDTPVTWSNLSYTINE